jgi:multimeric flavodoxin WrbA
MVAMIESLGVDSMAKILVMYHTFSGNTEQMANTIAEGARGVGDAEVTVKRVADVTLDEFAAADAVAFGAPNTFGGMAGALREFFDRAWGVRESATGKPVAVFSSENEGQTKALEDIERFVGLYKMNLVSEGVMAVKAPDENERKACLELGKSLVQAI